MLSKMTAVQPEKKLVINDSRKKSNKKSQEEAEKKRPPAVIADLDRKASNSNWEKFKNLVADTSVEKENSTREHPKPKPAKRHKMKQTERKLLPFPPMVDSANSNNTAITKQIAIDCEMVGIGDGTESMIARVSIVNRFGVCIYDKYVKPREKVQDYRSAVSGIYPHHLNDGEDFKTVQAEVAEILRGRILIGHALRNDLAVLFLPHPKWRLRDTSRYKPFRQIAQGGTPSLKKLATELLGLDIQRGEHNSVEDARTAMQLYMLYRKQWEQDEHSKR